MSRIKTLSEVFWSKVKKTEECWIWQGAKDRDGYGLLSYRTESRGKKRNLRAHRAAIELNQGQIPNNLHVLHKCDNPSCVNPDHLFLGTAADNNKDARDKGRAILDSRRKFDLHLLNHIKNVFNAGGYTVARLARTYGISETHAHRIIKSK